MSEMTGLAMGIVLIFMAMVGFSCYTDIRVAEINAASICAEVGDE